MIKVDNVVKKYGNVEAIRGVSFEVKKGEILGFLGPNGAGKTTLMRILTGYFPPTEGVVTIDGKCIENETLTIQRSIGYLPENVPLYHEMRVCDFLRYVAEVKGVAKNERRTHIEKVMADCGLTAMAKRQIKKLSKGYKQRVGLAQALISDPQVLILDEPTTGLDPRQIIEIRELIKGMAGNKTVILSTHILPEVSVVCDRVIIINEGKIIAIDTPDNLEKRLTSGLDIVVHVRGEITRVTDAIESIQSVVHVSVDDCNDGTAKYIVSAVAESDVRNELSKIISTQFEMLEMKTVRLSLEDIFVKLVTDESKQGAV